MSRHVQTVFPSLSRCAPAVVSQFTPSCQALLVMAWMQNSAKKRLSARNEKVQLSPLLVLQQIKQKNARASRAWEEGENWGCWLACQTCLLIYFLRWIWSFCCYNHLIYMPDPGSLGSLRCFETSTHHQRLQKSSLEQVVFVYLESCFQQYSRFTWLSTGNEWTGVGGSCFFTTL